jgi:hypothetical protein
MERVSEWVQDEVESFEIEGDEAGSTKKIDLTILFFWVRNEFSFTI